MSGECHGAAAADVTLPVALGDVTLPVALPPGPCALPPSLPLALPTGAPPALPALPHFRVPLPPLRVHSLPLFPVDRGQIATSLRLRHGKWVTPLGHELVTGTVQIRYRNLFQWKTVSCSLRHLPTLDHDSIGLAPPTRPRSRTSPFKEGDHPSLSSNRHISIQFDFIGRLHLDSSEIA